MRTMVDGGNTFITVGIGELLWDMLPEARQLGGAPANFACYALALGSRAVIASAVGNDKLGTELLTRLARMGLNGKFITIDKDHPTGKATVKLDPAGKPSYTIQEQTAWDYILLSEDLLELAGRANAVCFGTLAQRSEFSRQSIQQFIRATKPDCLRIFDVNLRRPYFDRQIIHKTLKVSNVLKLNQQELRIVADLLDIPGSDTDILSHLSRRYELNLIAVTRGPSGSRLYTRTKNCDHPGYPARIADTIGAGDAFTAALTLGLLQGQALDKINDQANRLASFVCSKHGAMPKLPDSLVEEFV